MRIRVMHRWFLGLAIIALAMSVMPAVAQTGLKPENTLSKITLNSKFTDVLAMRGMPNAIGPSISSTQQLTGILAGAIPMGMAAAPGTPGAPPGMAPAPGMPTMGAAGGPAQPAPQYTIWMYDHKLTTSARSPQWHTFVFFDKFGTVVGVAVALTDLDALSEGGLASPIKSVNNIGFGESMMNLVRKFGWPDPFSTVGPYFYCSYPDQGIAFSLNTAKRQVVGMAIGLPVTAMVQAVQPVRTPGYQPQGYPGGGAMYPEDTPEGMYDPNTGEYMNPETGEYMPPPYGG